MRNPALVLLAALVALTLFVSPGSADDKKPKKKAPTTTCPVSGKEIKVSAAKVVAYKKAKLYLCCKGCETKLKKDTKKYAAKANAQLVETKQFVQTGCPISGRPLKKGQTTMVGKAKVGFCCGNCKGKVAKAKGDKKVDMVFSEKAFAKAFAAPKKKKKKQK
jgi:hypothetical protein